MTQLRMITTVDLGPRILRAGLVVGVEDDALALNLVASGKAQLWIEQASIRPAARAAVPPRSLPRTPKKAKAEILSGSAENISVKVP